ncbi:MAG: RHS repeat-associated core domain-containing protein [Flavobacteriaceae bacterium]|jgi:RHS repeat-associated protein|nr:RHS repeat-associated core domain-containing protein [Flavobacteriaceae bacterium]
MAFVEVLYEEHSCSFVSSYLYNAKELDRETGLYYYGARYYDPKVSVFLSVDPLAEKFVGWNPYHYVHNSPINLIDLTGDGCRRSYYNRK